MTVRLIQPEVINTLSSVAFIYENRKSLKTNLCHHIKSCFSTGRKTSFMNWDQNSLVQKNASHPLITSWTRPKNTMWWALNNSLLYRSLHTPCYKVAGNLTFRNTQFPASKKEEQVGLKICWWGGGLKLEINEVHVCLTPLSNEILISYYFTLLSTKASIKSKHGWIRYVKC